MESIRYLCTLRKYVRNLRHPEGSIAEGYLADECLTFCSRYLDDEVETKFNRPMRNNDDCTSATHDKMPIFAGTDRALSKAHFRNLSDEEWEQARLYVLSNCDEVLPFIDKHKVLGVIV